MKLFNDVTNTSLEISDSSTVTFSLNIYMKELKIKTISSSLPNRINVFTIITNLVGMKLESLVYKHIYFFNCLSTFTLKNIEHVVIGVIRATKKRGHAS